MNLKKIAAAGVLAAVLVGTTATSAFAESSSSSSSTTTCLPDGAADTFPTWIENEPTVRNGVNLWHDTSGWHVRVKHATPRGRVFSGVIRTAGELNDVANVTLEVVEVLLARVDAPLVVASGYLDRDHPRSRRFRHRERRTLDGWAADLFERAE